MKLKLRFAVVMLMAAFSSLAVGQTLQDRFFDSKGVHIQYVEQGMGEPVVLVRGFGTSANLGWVNSKVFQQLAKDYRVIAFDCRGHGNSDKLYDTKQYAREIALDAVRLLDHLNIKKAHIVGYSMGGFIVAKLLTMKPERFATATLGGSGGILAPTESQLKLFEQVGSDIEQGSLRTLLSTFTPKDQPPQLKSR